MAGRGIKGGNYIYLDVRHLGKEKILSRIPFAREEGLRLAGVDCIDHPLPVRPTAHYSMGGIPTNINCQVIGTDSHPITGFFAAGETACVSVHGANRLGANSLLECVVFGKRAGEKLGEYVSDRAMPKLVSHPFLIDSEAKLKQILSKQGKSRIADIRQQLQDTMTEHCGIFRDDQHLKNGLVKLQTIRDRYENDLLIDDHSSIFNMELMQAIELKSLFTVGEIIMSSALSRQESRGAHSREDFPQRDDANYLKHTLGYLENGKVNNSDRPVDMSLQAIDCDRFTPQERKY
jgi:succinate dehydrogenase / fumarate reductase flavoprotein subunit